MKPEGVYISPSPLRCTCICRQRHSGSAWEIKWDDGRCIYAASVLAHGEYTFDDGLCMACADAWRAVGINA